MLSAGAIIIINNLHTILHTKKTHIIYLLASEQVLALPNTGTSVKNISLKRKDITP